MRRIVVSVAAGSVMAVAILLVSGVALAAVINGTDGNDELTGTNADDSIYALGGIDTVDGLEGSDVVYGGAQDDELLGSAGVDLLYGDSGGDTLDGGYGGDSLYGGPEDDAGIDNVYGGGGNDVIMVDDVPASRDVVDCGDGTDTVVADENVDDLAANCEEPLLVPPAGTGDVVVNDPVLEDDTITILNTSPFRGVIDCNKQANNPHVATRSTKPGRWAKGFGGLYCGNSKDRLWSKVYLFRTSNGTAGPYRLKAVETRGSVYDKRENRIGAQRKCQGHYDGYFRTFAKATVGNNGHVHRDHIGSTPVILDCNFD